MKKYTIEKPQSVTIGNTSFNEMHALSIPENEWVEMMYETHSAKHGQLASGLLGNRDESKSKAYLKEVYGQLKALVEKRDTPNVEKTEPVEEEKTEVDESNSAKPVKRKADHESRGWKPE